MSDVDYSSKKRQREGPDDEDEVGPLPSTALKKSKQKRRNVQFHSLYRDQLPNQPLYEKSYMHRTNLTHIEVAKTDFIITASSDGQVDFWKKEPTGIRFYKQIRAHMEPIVCMSVSYDGLYLATISADKNMKVYDVRSFDMTCILKLDFLPSVCAWVYNTDVSKTLIACGSSEDGIVRVYDPQSGEKKPETGASVPHSLFSLHKAAVKLMRYNVAYNAVMTMDVRGMVEYWNPETMSMPEGVDFKLKTETDYFTQFSMKKSAPLSLDLSPDGELVATMSHDYHVRLFKFRTGKLYREYDESLATQTAHQKDGMESHKLDPIDFGRRMAVEKSIIEKGDVAPVSNVIFDHSGVFVLYPTLLGIKVVNIKTNKLECILGKNEANERYMSIALYQGRTVGSAYLDNLKVDAQEDPTVFACAFKKNRFYLFTRREPVDGGDDNGRDVLNEKPSKEDIRAALPSSSSDKDKGDRKASSAIIHTTYGDIHVTLYKDDAPKTVENFTIHSRRGYYNGLLFHRVVKDFVIQTGDPLGDGTGGSSIWETSFEDEISPKWRHDSPGVLSMANSGPNTNGSQFFITTVPTPHLDGKHTIFGRVTKGLDVVRAIERVKVDKQQKPLEPIKMINIDIAS
jgi:peptidylprolyl isomerase domain and WD repeat-containing protein 1